MKEKSKWFGYLILGIILIVLYKLLDNFAGISQWLESFFGVLMPFVLAVIFAYILYIPSKAIENKIEKVKFLNKKSRALSVLIVYLIVLVLIITMVNVVIPSISKSITELTSKLPEFYRSAREYFSNLPEDSILRKIDIGKIISTLEQTNIIDKALSLISFENISNYAKGVFGAAGIIFDIFVIIIVSIYLLLERDSIKKFFKEFFKSIFDKKTNEQISKYYRKANKVFNAFISSQVLDAFIIRNISFYSFINIKSKICIDVRIFNWII